MCKLCRHCSPLIGKLFIPSALSLRVSQSLSPSVCSSIYFICHLEEVGWGLHAINCSLLLPPSPPLPCSRNDAKLSVISRVFALPMESASSSSSRSLDDGEKEKRGEGAGERGGRSGRGHRFIFGNNSHHLFSRVTRVPIRPTDRPTDERPLYFFAERRRREIVGGASRGRPCPSSLSSPS